jgi:hypothetical protein
MAKKAKKSFDVIEYVKQILSFAVPLIAENKDTIAKGINNMVNFKKIARKYMILSVFLLVASFFLLNGIVVLIGYLFPGSVPGISNIIIGIILFLLAMIYSSQKI